MNLTIIHVNPNLDSNNQTKANSDVEQLCCYATLLLCNLEYLCVVYDISISKYYLWMVTSKQK
jgi:hypothetical protein